MRAAVYVRRSKLQPGVAEEDKSVARQEAGAREWIANQKWSLSDVYKDEGVSGALFANRPGFQRMLRDAEADAFDAVVLFDLDRFGRNARKTMEALHELDDLGIEVWDYSTGQRVDLDSFGGRLRATLDAEFAQQYRETIGKKVRASHASRVRNGKPASGVPFGYRNTHRPEEPKKKFIVIVEDEARIVRDIFARYATGESVASIVRHLNSTGQLRRTRHRNKETGEWYEVEHRWNKVTLARILKNPIYRGELVWGRSAMIYKFPKTTLVVRGPKAGQQREKGQIAVPELTPDGRDQWIRASVPELKIIDEAILARVDIRLRASRELYLKSKCAEALRKAPHKAHGKFLLSGGMLICPTCGGHFEGQRSGTAWKGRGVYLCSARKHKPGSCTNRLILDMDEMDELVLHQLEGELLSPRYITNLLALVQDTPDDNARLLTEKEELARRKRNLLDSVAKGIPAEDIAPLLQEINDKIAKLDAALHRPRPVVVNKEKLKAALEQKVVEWREILRGEPRVARLLVRRIIGPITLWEDEPQPAVPDFLQKYVGLPEHLRPKRAPHWSSVPGEVPAPGAPALVVRWSAEAKPEAMLEEAGDISNPTGTRV